MSCWMTEDDVLSTDDKHWTVLSGKCWHCTIGGPQVLCRTDGTGPHGATLGQTRLNYGLALALHCVGTAVGERPSQYRLRYLLSSRWRGYRS